MDVGADLYMCDVVKKVHVRYLISWWVLVNYTLLADANTACWSWVWSNWDFSPQGWQKEPIQVKFGMEEHIAGIHSHTSDLALICQIRGFRPTGATIHRPIAVKVVIVKFIHAHFGPGQWRELGTGAQSLNFGQLNQLPQYFGGFSSREAAGATVWND